MSEVIISYAYDGFIYLPIFLANYWGYFPQDTELKYSNGDEEALKELLSLDGARTGSHFAICDPLIVGDLDKLEALKVFGEKDMPVVVGSLIKKLPFWVFNNNPSVLPVAKIEDLKGQIHKIRCYEKPNTGYLLGRNIENQLNIQDDAYHFREVKFNQEFDSPLENDEVVLTSNILRMGELGFNDHNIIYSYPKRHQSADTLFFTGILTRHSIFSQDLPLVLSVLKGIQKAISKIKTEDINTLVETIFTCLGKDLKKDKRILSTDDIVIKTIIKDSIEIILRREDIYSENLEIKREAWEKSIQLRQSALTNWKAPSYEIFTKEIPVILLQDKWHDKIKLITPGRFSKETTMMPLQNKVSEPILILIISLLFLYAAYETYGALTNPADLGRNIVCVILELIFFVLALHRQRIIVNQIRKGSNATLGDYSTWFVFLGIILAILFSGFRVKVAGG